MGQCAKCGRSKECDYVWKDPSEPYMNCVSYTPPSPTNGDWIRLMSDEELADLIAEYIDCDMCKFEDEECLADCELRWRKWLREEKPCTKN